VAVEVAAEIGWQAVDVAAEIKHRVARGLSRERTDGGADRVRFGPAALAREGLETFEVSLVQIYLQRSCHDHDDRRYAVMTRPSMTS